MSGLKGKAGKGKKGAGRAIRNDEIRAETRPDQMDRADQNFGRERAEGLRPERAEHHPGHRGERAEQPGSRAKGKGGEAGRRPKDKFGKAKGGH